MGMSVRTPKFKQIVGTAALAALAAGMLAACGGGSSGGGSTAAASARGPITYVQGKDNSNIVGTLADLWNKDHPTEKVTIKQQSDSADDQHQDLVQNFQAKSANYDVMSVDVVWTAEFAAKQWLTPLTGGFKLDESTLLPATVKAATYNDTLYAGPYASDGGLLYYRKDMVPTAPTKWSELIADCANKGSMDCYAGQFAQYEGLTVNAAEAINSAGGEIVKSDGKTPDVDTPAAKAGLSFLVDGFKQGYIPANALTFKEEGSLGDFESGKLMFLRNWPYAYGLLSTDPTSQVKDKFGIAPLPGLTGPGASSLGGHSLAISQFSKHKATALDFIKFMQSSDIQKLLLTKASLAPVISSLYTDPALVSQFAYLPTLLQSIQKAVPRPVTPFYPAITNAIQQNVYSALQGQKTVDQALSDLQAAIKSAAGGS